MTMASLIKRMESKNLSTISIIAEIKCIKECRKERKTDTLFFHCFYLKGIMEGLEAANIISYSECTVLKEEIEELTNTIYTELTGL